MNYELQSRLRRRKRGQRLRGEHGGAIARRRAAAHGHAADRRKMMPPRQFEAVAKTLVDPIR